MSDSIFEADELSAQTDLQAPAAEGQQQAEQPPVDPGQPRDEHGRFAPKGGDQSADADGADPEKPRMVDLGALHKERAEKKDWRQKAEAAQAKLDAFAELRQRVAQQQAPAIQHDPESDPTGVNYLAAQIAELRQSETQRQQQQQISQVDELERNELHRALNDAETEFRTVAPDYDAAITHLATARARELQRYGMLPAQIQSVLSQEALELTASAVRMGVSPAALAYDIAQDRGYRGQPPAEKQQPQPALNPAIAQIQAINKGQAASRSLGGAGGAPASNDLNAKALVDMDDDEFARLIATPEGKKLFESLG